MLYAITQESSLDSFFCKSPYDTTTPMILHSNKNAPELLCLEVYALELSGSLVSISVSVHCIGSMTLSVHFCAPSFLSELLLLHSIHFCVHFVVCSCVFGVFVVEVFVVG